MDFFRVTPAKARVRDIVEQISARALVFFVLGFAAAFPSSVRALVRAPQVAGQFYPADPKELRRQIDILLRRAVVPALRGEPIALLIPHAGMEFSGLATARALNAVDPGRFDRVIIIGTGHYAAVRGAAIYPGDYATPMGKVAYDPAFAHALENASPLIVESAEAHEREHSIEDDLPFLQKRLGAFKLVAMVMNTEEFPAMVEIGLAVAKVVRAVGGKMPLIIASSDLSHYPAAEVDNPVDGTTLAALKTLDPEFFWTTNRLLMGRRLPNLACTYCGEGAVTAVLVAARALGANEFRLLQHFNSGDSAPQHEYDRVVGYAAGVFAKEKSASPGDFPYDLSDQEKRILLREAREAIRARLDGKESPPAPLSDVPGFNLPAAVFVTLDSRGPGKASSLRGCVGTAVPEISLLDAVRRYAQAAAFEDARFHPLTASELDRVAIEISILSRPESISNADAVRPGMGVTVEKNGRSGLFLPQVWDEIKDKTAFLEKLCSQKAGLPRGCWRDPAARLSTFSVQKFSE